MSNFFSLPRELRDQIYHLCLLHEEPLDPWHDYNQQDLTLGLLRTSKHVHREASWLFYTQNRFDFTTATPEDVALFLGTIGSNADYIRHVHIDFPQFLHLEPGHVTLEESDVDILANIQSGCANLATLTTTPYSTNAMELSLDATDHPKVVAEALKLVDTHFRAISSLQEIIIKVYEDEDGPNAHIRREMESHGWTISTTENVEEGEFDGRWSDIGSDHYGYGHDGDSDDYQSYDIDNDSDFWRRAGD